MQLAATRNRTAAVHPDHGTTSFDAVARERYPELLRLAWLLTGDRHQAEDAVGEALARSLRRWDSTSIAQPAAYLRRAVVNEVNSSFRRLRTRRAQQARRHGDHRGQRPADEQVVDADAIGRALTQLPIKQRTAVVLRFYEGLSQAETAEVMGCSVGAVKSNCARGLDRLRTLLEGG